MEMCFPVVSTFPTFTPRLAVLHPCWAEQAEFSPILTKGSENNRILSASTIPFLNTMPLHQLISSDQVPSLTFRQGKKQRRSTSQLYNISTIRAGDLPPFQPCVHAA
ncbi:uncharacterized protein MYCGRDRAFT_91551 [Zymoseptoria tritici IPO323]|uniref:Uncharacterized protein n=1 Tax=Zymoseptoria tritici (strain CBS 115943 / IPO323) TaxID=336722 RepID=F9X666_ZYMTI|nr:uncharacterized protein MYCGRDRAFT_91551 [Zymoseptoria tritici IPO323]EGP88724.1 hypothetical protein MYCGRDRAFT_91551 [Zymoseptoria tritici IPO323]